MTRREQPTVFASPDRLPQENLRTVPREKLLGRDQYDTTDLQKNYKQNLSQKRPAFLCTRPIGVLGSLVPSWRAMPFMSTCPCHAFYVDT